MINSLFWISVDVIFMILNHIDYKRYNRWYNAFFVILFFMLAMLEIYLMNTK